MITWSEIVKQMGPNPSLERLLKAAVKYKMTDEELNAQRASWVKGEMGLGLDNGSPVFDVTISRTIH